MVNQDSLPEISTDVKVTIGIDEFSIVLKPIQKVNILEWFMHAENIIDEFLNLSKIREVFGELEPTNSNLVQGYKIGYLLTNRPFYLCLCYHDEFESMGVCCKFSATAYARFKEEYFIKYGQKMNLRKFLLLIESNKYTNQISRIDIAVDYFNFPCFARLNQYLCPNTIYDCLIKKQIKVVNHKNNSNIRTFSSINKDGIHETVYIGSRKGNTRTFLRIYDKKNEQIEKAGIYQKIAQENASWTRFEGVFKGIYAHQIGEMIAEKGMIQTDQELCCFLAGKIVDKYVFRCSATDELLNFSELLIDIATGKEFPSLECTSPRDNSLFQSLRYIIKNSGLLITLAKAHFIYPCQNAEEKILEWIYMMFEEYYLEKIEKNEKHEVYKWLKKHREEIAKEKLEDILESVQTDILLDEEWTKKVISSTPRI